MKIVLTEKGLEIAKNLFEDNFKEAQVYRFKPNTGVQKLRRVMSPPYARERMTVLNAQLKKNSPEDLLQSWMLSNPPKHVKIRRPSNLLSKEGVRRYNDTAPASPANSVLQGKNNIRLESSGSMQSTSTLPFRCRTRGDAMRYSQSTYILQGLRKERVKTKHESLLRQRQEWEEQRNKRLEYYRDQNERLITKKIQSAMENKNNFYQRVYSSNTSQHRYWFRVSVKHKNKIKRWKQSDRILRLSTPVHAIQTPYNKSPK